MKKFIYSSFFLFFLTLAIIIVNNSGEPYKSHWLAYWHGYWFAVVLGFIIGGGGPLAYVIYTNKNAGDPSPWPVIGCWIVGLLGIIIPYSVSLGS